MTVEPGGSLCPTTHTTTTYPTTPSTTYTTTPKTTTAPTTTYTTTPSTTYTTTPPTTTAPPTTYTTTPSTTTAPTTTYPTTPPTTTCKCRDPQRGLILPCGMTWTEDCFDKTCDNGRIISTPVTFRLSLGCPGFGRDAATFTSVTIPVS
ncbi:integumentary mucin A.1-like [Alosa sapidissima]|uniref:integumentary mucin A.1-like n=1 Tax=Alosa sapidissima TaxID=34773 RepID=UPI001C0A5D09|nr:integumentary mucin A.1-like [Alosa sapidissima]